VNEWKQKALAEKDPVTLAELMIALARKGDAKDKNAILTALQGVDYVKLSESQQIDLIRAFELTIARMACLMLQQKQLSSPILIRIIPPKAEMN
jgi:hypothetical protein